MPVVAGFGPVRGMGLIPIAKTSGRSFFARFFFRLALAAKEVQHSTSCQDTYTRRRALDYGRSSGTSRADGQERALSHSSLTIDG